MANGGSSSKEHIVSTVSHEQFVGQLRAALGRGCPQDPAPTLARIASFTRRAVQADAAGFSLLTPDGRLRTLGESDRLVITTDAMQDQLHEGPAIDLTSILSTNTTQSHDLLTETRWSRWAPLAAHLGFRSLLAIGLPSVDTGGRAIFTVYSRPVRRFDRSDLETIRLIEPAAGAALRPANLSNRSDVVRRPQHNARVGRP